jgi:hypothetical protein
MSLYIGIIENEGINRLYISSVPVDDDRFETESVLADCSPRGLKNTEAAMLDLRILRNKLTNGDIPNKLIVMEDS